ncbi:hypothetical protein F5Y14DRAFT_400340 [Nemania sp. NC0429]|nr:hypothetical protein F5Y14DRAFT_400340 [Nemania sp. NC0429]
MHPLHTLQKVNRRVAIQSPVTDNIDGENVVPMSVEKERLTRRQAALPTSIMKPAVPQADDERPGEQSYKTPRPTTTTQPRISLKRRNLSRDVESALVSHSAYNRPVLGTSVQTTEATETTASEMLSAPHKRIKAEKTVKRENVEEGTRQSAEEHPTKLSHSMSNYFQDPNPTQATTTPLQPQAWATRLRGGPIDRRLRSWVTYGESSATRLRSDSSTTATLSEGSGTSPLQNPLQNR